MSTPGFNEHLAATGIAFTDGSGGKTHLPVGIAKVGAGVATLELDNTVEDEVAISRREGLGATVPGRQTVPRAELWAARSVRSLSL